MIAENTSKDVIISEMDTFSDLEKIAKRELGMSSISHFLCGSIKFTRYNSKRAYEIWMIAEGEDIYVSGEMLQSGTGSCVNQRILGWRLCPCMGTGGYPELHGGAYCDMCKGFISPMTPRRHICPNYDICTRCLSRLTYY